MDPEQFQEVFKRLETEVQKVIVGHDDLIRKVLIAFFGGGHVLLEGVPGLGKTLLVKSLSRALGMSFKRIQFTPDLMPSDIVGTEVLTETNGRREFQFKQGPIFAHVVLADEIDRATPKTQSAVLEAMEEKQVTVFGESHILASPFIVLATQNPIEHHGTYPLPESQLDRFLLRVHMGYPHASNEREILRSEAGAARLNSIEPVASGADVLAMQDEVTLVKVDDSLVDYALEIVRRTRESETLSLGVSPRGSLMLYRAAQAIAFLEGRTFAIPDDFKRLAVSVFAHRAVVNARFSSSALRSSDHAEKILREIVETVPVPS